jgi:hypothetical protein
LLPTEAERLNEIAFPEVTCQSYGSSFYMIPMRYLLPLLSCFILSSCARHSDRDWLYREFEIPQNVQLGSVHSSPEQSGSDWAQRKGLKVDGRFKFSPTQLLDYRHQVDADSSPWRPLPLPKDLIAKMDAHYSTDLTPQASHGFYRCQTAAGKNLLISSQRQAWDTTAKLDDYVLGVLDTDKAELGVRVRQFDQ